MTYQQLDFIKMENMNLIQKLIFTELVEQVDLVLLE